jgi:retron-type reverse transcriptase
MPVTHNNIWDQIVNFENMYEAFRGASRAKRFRGSVLRYGQNLEENLINALNQLTWKQWKPSRYREFFVYEPKKRTIHAPPFKDRVVHHALVQIIEPLFERTFIPDSFACRTGKGTHAAKMRVESFAVAADKKWGDYYVLKADIKGYFPSIDRNVLFELIKRTISDKDTLWLIGQIIDCDGDKRGVPIGALTSQLFANIYLDALDHYVKDDLGVKMYARYMDDFVVVHPDKDYLKKLHADIEVFITERLHLTFNPKTTIFKSGNGTCHPIDFCGYRMWPDYTKPRIRTVKGARKRFKKFVELYREGLMNLEQIRVRIASFLGYMKHCDGKRSVESVLDRLIFSRGTAPALL